jgi:hypothetical protein
MTATTLLMRAFAQRRHIDLMRANGALCRL